VRGEIGGGWRGGREYDEMVAGGGWRKGEEERRGGGGLWVGGEQGVEVGGRGVE